MKKGTGERVSSLSVCVVDHMPNSAVKHSARTPKKPLYILRSQSTAWGAFAASLFGLLMVLFLLFGLVGSFSR